MMMKRSLTFAAALMLAASVAWADEQVRWLNVHVSDHSDATEVKLHLPFSMVLTLIDAVQTDELRNGKVHIDIDEADVDWVAIVEELKRSPEGEFITVEDREAHVVVSKKAGLVSIDVEERGPGGEKVKIRLQEPLLAAFSIDVDNRLDLKALLASLESVGGELLTVESDDANVRVWVE